MGSRAKPYGNTRNSALNEGHWVLFAVLTAWWGGNRPPPLTVQREVKGNVRLTLEYLCSGIQMILVHVHEDIPNTKIIFHATDAACKVETCKKAIQSKVLPQSVINRKVFRTPSSLLSHQGRGPALWGSWGQGGVSQGLDHV